MGILDQYKAALEVEKEKESMDFPSDTNLTEKDKEAYEETLNKMRKGNFSNEEIKEAINNSRKNMAALNEVIMVVLMREQWRNQQRLVMKNLFQKGY